MNSIKIQSGATKMVAHRGLSGIELENTNASFIAAGNRSYYGIETDVHKTSDGKFVVFHDDNTGRLCDTNLSVEGTPFETLRGLTLTDREGHKDRADAVIPTLREYIRTCKRYEKIAVLELKNAFEKEEIRAICDEITEEDYLANVIFISFSFENLVFIREFYPAHPVQFLTEKYDEELLIRLPAHGFDIDIEYTELNEERVKAFHEKGISINCWTCDDKAFAQDLVKWGVDMLTTNILE